MTPGAGASLVVVIDRLRAWLTGWDVPVPSSPGNRSQSDPSPIRYPIGELRTAVDDAPRAVPRTGDITLRGASKSHVGGMLGSCVCPTRGGP